MKNTKETNEVIEPKILCDICGRELNKQGSICTICHREYIKSLESKKTRKYEETYNKITEEILEKVSEGKWKVEKISKEDSKSNIEYISAKYSYGYFKDNLIKYFDTNLIFIALFIVLIAKGMEKSVFLGMIAIILTGIFLIVKNIFRRLKAENTEIRMYPHMIVQNQLFPFGRRDRILYKDIQDIRIYKSGIFNQKTVVIVPKDNIVGLTLKGVHIQGITKKEMLFIELVATLSGYEFSTDTQTVSQTAIDAVKKVFKK